MSDPRFITALDLGQLSTAEINTLPPVLIQVTPESLRVDAAYQRSLSRNSIALITRIVANWDWRRFKPPVVSDGGDGIFDIIDGQHTAIAAASHPAIKTIPVMVIQTGEQTERASAFVGHNRDRLNLSPTQLYYAELAAGDDEAVTIAQVCERAGVNILKNNPSRNYVWEVGDTMSIKCIRTLIDRRGAMAARKILQVLVGACAAPVAVLQVLGVEMLIHNPEFGLTHEQVSAVLDKHAIADLERDAAVFAATHSVSKGRAFAIVIFQKLNKRGAVK